MGKPLLRLLPLSFALLCLSGCSAIGDKAASISVIYGVAAFLSLLLLVGYCAIVKKRDPWYLLLFASVLLVNIGYLALSLSRDLAEALLANRLSYLGSVFLPLSMWMIILNSTQIRYRKWLPTVLLALAVVMFLIAASPGYSTVYYKEVSFAIVNGVGSLQKVYGPLHGLYLIYLLGYFTAMIATIVHATVMDKIESLAYSVMIAIAVFVNIGVWVIEQLVYIEFEVLSISYIISESFLLGLHALMAEAEKAKAALTATQESTPPPKVPAVRLPEPEPMVLTQEEQLRFDRFCNGLHQLTMKEREIFDCYVAGMRTDEIMEKLNIKENTLKFHNKNLYSKLGVRSRKQLVELHNNYAVQASRSR